MKNTYKKIKGHEKLISRFGSWPTFHDAEVISFSIVRQEESKFDGPNAYVEIHIFDIKPQQTDKDELSKFHNHCIVTFHFVNIDTIKFEGFNQQNAILDLNFREEYSDRLKRTLYEVEFEPAFGISCILKCCDIRIESVKKGIPEYSIYK